MRCIEFFSGIGGWRFSLERAGIDTQIIHAIDISPQANDTYLANHGHAPLALELASLGKERLKSWKGELWAMSPPCQPFCRMGHQKGLEDPRSKAFLRILELMEACPPDHVLLENVDGFKHSPAHEALAKTFEKLGFQSLTLQACPSQWGIPNQRPRTYIVASRKGLKELNPPPATPIQNTIADFLDTQEDPSLYLSEVQLEKYTKGLDLVSPDSQRSACFIGGYGQRFVGSGSFLKTPKGIRRFSPREIARLLGLPEAFKFPAGISLEKQYKLLGNGLSIPVAAWAAQHLGCERG